MVCRHFGRTVGISDIREVVHTSTDGTSLAGITAGAEELGLAARSVRASKNRLDELPAAGDRPLGGQPLGRRLRVGREARARRRPGARAPARPARRSSSRSGRGYAALVAYTERSPMRRRRGTSLAWLKAFFRPHRRTLLIAGRARVRRGRAAAAAADLDAGRRRPASSRTATSELLWIVLADDRGGAAGDHRSDARPALHAQPARCSST